MNKRITFRHMDHSDVLEAHINEKLAKIEKFLENERLPIFIDLVMEPSKRHAHNRIEFRIKSPSYDLICEHEYANEKFYDCLDRVIDTMYKQLLEKKRKNHDLHKQEGRHEEVKKQR